MLTSFHFVEEIEEGPRLGSILNTRSVVGDVVDVRERTVIGFLRLPSGSANWSTKVEKVLLDKSSTTPSA